MSHLYGEQQKTACSNRAVCFLFAQAIDRWQHHDREQVYSWTYSGHDEQRKKGKKRQAPAMASTVIRKDYVAPAKLERHPGQEADDLPRPELTATKAAGVLVVFLINVCTEGEPGHPHHSNPLFACRKMCTHTCHRHRSSNRNFQVYCMEEGR